MSAENRLLEKSLDELRWDKNNEVQFRRTLYTFLKNEIFSNKACRLK
jgi:hypothetical protein